MTAPTTSADVRFSQVLREATFVDHREAAGAGFMHALMSGALPVGAYADLAVQQWHIYTELEAGADRYRDHPLAGAFVHDVLARRPSIEGDLATLLGDNWRSAGEALPATLHYVERMRSAMATSPAGFVAHHYTRYLGDLSGGQFIGRAIDRSYGFAGGPGARFYVFDQIDDADAFKEAYRRALDTTAWSTDDRDVIIAEVRVAYGCNQSVIEGLAATHLR